MQLPAEGTTPKWLFDALNIRIHVEGETGCQAQKRSEADGRSYKLPYPMMGLGALAGAAFAVWREGRRRYRSRSDDDSEGEDDETYLEDESYMEMSDRAVAGPKGGDVPPELPLVYQHPTLEHEKSGGSRNQSGQKKQISMETLRAWYAQQGIAIV